MNPIVNPGDKRRRSSAYRAELRKQSLDRLTGVNYSLQGHQFIIDDNTAEKMADAIASKNVGMMKEVFDDSIGPACAASLEAPLDTYTDEWNEALSVSSNQDVTLYDMITSGDVHAISQLKQALHGSRERQLVLQTDSYIRFLHTIALATIPDEGYRDRYTTNHNERKKTNIMGVHSTAMNILNNLATHEPGLRGLRESILDRRQELPIDTYLTRMQQSLTAQMALAHIIDLQGRDNVISAREAVLKELSEAEPADYDKELATHLLTWEILPHTHDDISDVICILKKRGKGLAKTRKARERFEQNWDDTRLEALFKIAYQEAEKGRHVEIYISSAFNNSQEFYVAAEFTHPENNQAKIVIVDNPMTGNALYLVDEEHTMSDEDGRNLGWKFVLGASKKIARMRGAKRRFHVGEWQKVTEEFCMNGLGASAIKLVDVAQEAAGETEVLVEVTEEVIEEREAPAEDSNEPKIDIDRVLKNIAEMRKLIDEAYSKKFDE